MIRRKFFGWLGGVFGFGATMPAIAEVAKAPEPLDTTKPVSTPKGSDWQERDPFDQHPGATWKKLSPELQAKVEEDVLNWLKTSKEAILEVWLKSAADETVGMLLFKRNEILVRTCANCWDVWYVATESSCPHMISYRAKELSNNAVDTDHRLHNEVRNLSRPESLAFGNTLVIQDK